MDRIVDVAQQIIIQYKKLTGENIDEMKLHKLLYFCQRETYAILGRPLFNEKMQGWKYGPVSPIVRSYFTPEGMNCKTRQVSNEAAYIINNIVHQYAPIAAWRLSQISHEEKSWLKSREGLAKDEPGDRELLEQLIMEDAQKVRPYDSLYDMYYDEFDDIESVAE